MRYAFGLGGLLIVLAAIAIMMHLEANEAATDLAAQKEVKPVIDKISGHSADGTPADQSAALQPQYDSSGKFIGLLAASVTPGGAYESQWGLKAFDLIVQIGPHDLRDPMNDPDMAKALMVDAVRYSQPLVVVRAGQHVTLPLPAAPTASGGATPHQPDQGGNPIQRQLDAIQNVPTH
jgi:hypothetical protein